MKQITLSLGEYQTNCYLLWDEDGACAVIDPGYDGEAIYHRALEEGLRIHAIFLTHGHFDHVGGVKALAQKAQCPVYLHPKERALPETITGGPLYETKAYGEGDRIRIGRLSFTVLETPGHTAGSVCLQVEDTLFTGDTLFAGSCGRTDLGGSWSAMEESLRRLGKLSGAFVVCPGHGPASTLERERNTNLYVRHALK